MRLAASPYHLTTRELPVMVGALLAERLITILPVPGWSGLNATASAVRGDDESAPASDGPPNAGPTATDPNGRALLPDQVRGALRACPRYLRVLERWRWSAPMWVEGVVASTLRGLDAADELASVCAGIRHDERWRTLRGYLHTELFASERDFLEGVSADLLKGGPDPGISLPLSASLDRFASRHGLGVLRQGSSLGGARRSGDGAGPRGRDSASGGLFGVGAGDGAASGAGGASSSGGGGSVAQRAEEQLGTTILSLGMPVFFSASGRLLLEAREALEPELAALRAVLSAALSPDAQRANGGASAARFAGEVRARARAYADAFQGFASDVVDHDDDLGERVRAGYVRVTCRRLPVEAVLMSSCAAVRQVQGLARRAANAAASNADERAGSGPAGSGGAAGDPSSVIVLVVNELAAAVA